MYMAVVQLIGEVASIRCQLELTRKVCQTNGESLIKEHNNRLTRPNKSLKLLLSSSHIATLICNLTKAKSKEAIIKKLKVIIWLHEFGIIYPLLSNPIPSLAGYRLEPLLFALFFLFCSFFLLRFVMT